MIPLIFDVLFSSILFVFTFTNPLIEKVKFIYKIMIFLGCFCLNLFLYNFPFVTYLLIICCISIIFCCTKNKLLSIILSLSGYTLAVVLNNIMLFLLQIVFNITVQTIYSSIYYQFTFYISFLVIVYFSTALLGHYAKKYFPLKKTEKYKKTITLIFLEMLMGTSLLIFNISYGQKIGYPPSTILFNAILFFIYFLLSTLLLLSVVRTTKKNILMEQKEAQYADLQNYMTNLEKSSVQLRQFKHDYLNTLMTLDELIHSNKQAELIAYFDSSIKPIGYALNGVNNQLSCLSHLKEPALKSLISAKCNYASLENINIRLEITSDIENISIEPLDLARIMGVFLDNAIEAACQAADSQITLAFIPMDGYLQIMIQNSCIEKELPIDTIYNCGFSTKGENRGYGLYQVKQLLSHYKNIIHTTSYENGIFTQALQIFANSST